eukprot:TRINITY_DN7494_c0_g1_i1.p1 TRINITY_DN7494_c0_g1~~TRINITY_DN7494_c0_g1_i1.p1  ORF type:complete len:440 (+),score=55.31 TRINITY_DN7494_c0_g1_i1:182-1321(+)
MPGSLYPWQPWQDPNEKKSADPIMNGREPEKEFAVKEKKKQHIQQQQRQQGKEMDSIMLRDCYDFETIFYIMLHIDSFFSHLNMNTLLQLREVSREVSSRVTSWVASSWSLNVSQMRKDDGKFITPWRRLSEVDCTVCPLSHDFSCERHPAPRWLSSANDEDGRSDGGASIQLYFTHLSFAVSFDQQIDRLPSSLTHLGIGALYNQPLHDDVLSALPSLTHLTFRKLCNYNYPLPLHLPTTLTHLTLGSNFNQNIDSLSLCPSLTHIIFGYSFNQPVDNLPASLTNLMFDNSFNQPVNRLPSSLTFLILGFSFNRPITHLPSSLQRLRFGDSYNQPLNTILLHSLSHLTHLYFGTQFNQPLSYYPLHLTHLLFFSLFQV